MSQSKARLVTTLVIEFDDPSDAPVFAETVKLVLKVTRKLSLNGAVRMDAYGDLGGGDLEQEHEVTFTIGELNALARFMPAPECLYQVMDPEEIERLRPDYRSAWKKIVGP